MYSVANAARRQKYNSLKVKTKREIITVGLKRHRFSAQIHNIKKSPRKNMCFAWDSFGAFESDRSYTCQNFLS